MIAGTIGKKKRFCNLEMKQKFVLQTNFVTVFRLQYLIYAVCHFNRIMTYFTKQITDFRDDKNFHFGASMKKIHFLNYTCGSYFVDSVYQYVRNAENTDKSCQSQTCNYNFSVSRG